MGRESRSRERHAVPPTIPANRDLMDLRVPTLECYEPANPDGMELELELELSSSGKLCGASARLTL
eukprot:3205860-Rhodomonas_salina.1